MATVYKPDRPGAAISVVKNGQAIFRKAYGLANLELNVPMRPEMVFRLCSVTKQFTAAAIFMLAEQGKAVAGRRHHEVPARLSHRR